MKDCLSLHFLGWKFLMMKEMLGKDEKSFTYNVRNIRHSVRRSIIGGEVETFNQGFESPIDQFKY